MYDNIPRKCFVCFKEIESKDFLMGATSWESVGNYGSQVFDILMNSIFVDIVICDSCVLERKDFILLRTELPRRYTYEKLDEFNISIV